MILQMLLISLLYQTLLLVLKTDLGAWKNRLRRACLGKFFTFPQLDPVLLQTRHC